MNNETKCEGCALRDKRIRELEQMMRTIAEAVDEADGRIKATRIHRDKELFGRYEQWQRTES